MAYWWDDLPAERYWVEIRKVPDIGTSLYCPMADEDGGVDPWYELVASVRAGEVIYHWNAREHRFVGRSIAATDAVEDAARSTYRVPLEDFTPIESEVSLQNVRDRAEDIYSLRDDLLRTHGRPLYLPFQFKSDRTQLGFMSNYFAKLPERLVVSLFGDGGLAEGLLPVAPESQELSPPAGALVPSGGIRSGGGRAFLTPFRPKADTSYVVDVRGGRRVQTPLHEGLVNSCATWLRELGYLPGRNAAVDLGVDDPAVVIEAKIIRASWPRSVREAVGQLYEYRYFKVSSPNSALIFLADQAVPDLWVRYLEKDRHIGVLWPSSLKPGTFEGSRLAHKALGI
jgi:hypothetical protein